MCRLAKEEEMQESRKRVDELEKENLELATQLAKKEAELDVKTQANQMSSCLDYDSVHVHHFCTS